MNGLNNPLYVEALNNARVAERPGVALEALARDARQARPRPQWRRALGGLLRLVLVAGIRRTSVVTTAR